MLSTEPSPSMNTPDTITTSQPEPRPGLLIEAQEWIKRLDYEEDCMLREVELGVKDLLEKRANQKRQPMLATELSPWARKLKNHLKEFRPKEYAELLAAGNLLETVQDRTDQAALEMATCSKATCRTTKPSR